MLSPDAPRARPIPVNPREIWSELGASGRIRELWDGGQEHRTDPLPRRLERLLTDLDSKLPVPLVLAVCVQVGGSLPLLRSMATTSDYAANVLGLAMEGKAVVALAATDAELSGSALMHLRTELSPDGVLTGSKDWVVNAGDCDYALVLARHEPTVHFTSLTWVLLPTNRPGVRKSVSESEFDLAGLGELSFKGVPVAEHECVGGRGRGLALLAKQMQTERLCGSLWARSLCRRALTSTRDHLRRTSTGDGVLWDLGSVRLRWAEALVEYVGLDARCRAQLQDHTAAGSMALKAATGPAVQSILTTCIDLQGAAAFLGDGLARTRELATMFGIAGGTAGPMLAGVANHADELLDDS